MSNIKHIERTQPLRPSKIGLFHACPLRYVFETERPETGSLSPGPQVYLGIAFHGAIEYFWGRSSVSGIEVREWIRGEFIKKVTTQDVGLCNWLLTRKGIDAVISPSLVNDSSRLALQQIAASRYSISLGTPNNSENKQSIFGIERRLSSDVLDIAGRADLIEKSDDCVSIVDFKLGLPLDDSGEPKYEYLLQLAAYALIVREQLGDVDLILELRSPKKSLQHSFNPQLQASVKKVIQDMHTVLPRSKSLDVTTLAVKGEHCISCGYRFMCENYLSRLSATSEIQDDHVSPFDVMGQVISIEADREVAAITLLAQPDQRRVHISDIPTFLLRNDIKPGDCLAAFSLATPEVRGKGNYIANFHLWDSVNPRQSAFSAKIMSVDSLI